MTEHETFRVIRVSDSHGAGMELPSKFDATDEFDGKTISVQVPSESESSKKP
jgi:hypothetical protein